MARRQEWNGGVELEKKPHDTFRKEMMPKALTSETHQEKVFTHESQQGMKEVWRGCLEIESSVPWCHHLGFHLDLPHPPTRAHSTIAHHRGACHAERHRSQNTIVQADTWCHRTYHVSSQHTTATRRRPRPIKETGHREPSGLIVASF